MFFSSLPADFRTDRVYSFVFQAEDGIRDLVRSRGLGDVYKRQAHERTIDEHVTHFCQDGERRRQDEGRVLLPFHQGCLLYTSDAADERSSVDLGGRRIIKKKHI